MHISTAKLRSSLHRTSLCACAPVLTLRPNFTKIHNSRNPAKTEQSGFTLIELLVVIVIIGVLFGLSTINLGQANVTASLNSTASKLMASLKSQQILAMSGGTSGSGQAQAQGIHFGVDKYTLFSGTSYSASDPDNLTVNVSGDTSLTSTLPGDTILFSKASGEFSGYSASSNTITINNADDTKTITINQLGVAKLQ